MSKYVLPAVILLSFFASLVSFMASLNDADSAIGRAIYEMLTAMFIFRLWELWERNRR